MTIRITRKKIVALVAFVALAFVAVATAASMPGWYQSDEHTTDAIAHKAQSTDPYPISQINHFLERKNLIRRLLEFNQPSKIGYLYVMSFGKFVGYYTIQGKISSTQSQLTVVGQAVGDNLMAPSMGDDGSYGTEEGGDKGVFFFTTTGVMVETDLDWLYSDKPLHIDAPNLVK